MLSNAYLANDDEGFEFRFVVKKEEDQVNFDGSMLEDFHLEWLGFRMVKYSPDGQPQTNEMWHFIYFEVCSMTNLKFVMSIRTRI